jgi:YidC/Oxa1 family membrane protein insertase
MNKRSLIFFFVLSAAMLITNLFFKPKATPTAPKSVVEQQLQKPNFEAKNTPRDEKFYVLENEHQQLVFSNHGGAIAEINLPLKSQEHQTSKVYPLEFDEQLDEANSSHSLFPSRDYQVAGSNASKSPSKGGYYPMIRRNIDPAQDSSRYYAFNLVSNQPHTSELSYKVTHFTKDKIVFESNDGEGTITKTYALDPESPFGIDLTIKAEGDHGDLWLSTGVPEVELISNMQSPVIKYRQQNKNRFQIYKQKLPKETIENTSIAPDWVSNSNSFFTLLVDPQDSLAPGYKVNKVKGTTLPSRLASLDLNKKIKNSDGYEFLLPLKSDSDEVKFKIFAGPLEKSLLAQADQQKGTSSDYLSAQTYNGFLNFISEPCAKVLFIFLNLFHKITSSWGISIILLTILLRVILFPLNSWSIKAMRKNQEIAPEINAIQQKYKKTNPKQAQIEVMQLYRKRKVNPFTGCLPMLIQMPFLIGMFSLLRSAFVLRGAPFINGWINNLTSPDVLFSWSTSIPFFGTQFHLLPIISCVMLWLQQKVASPIAIDKSQMTDQQRTQKMMSSFMLIFVTLLCYNLPSGLNIYFISSTLLGILQQWITNRMLDNKKSLPTLIEKKKKVPLKETNA